MFFIGLSFGFFMLGSVYGGIFYGLASEETAILVTVTSEFVCLLLCVPLFFGYTSLCIKLVCGKETSVSDLFSYYTSASSLSAVYTHFLKLLPALFIKLVIPLFIIVLAFDEIEEIAPYFMPQILEASTAEVILKGVFIIPALILIIVCMYLLGKNIVKFLCFCSDENAAVGIIYKKGDFFALRLSMFPLYALSLLSFGVLFIAYTFPMTVIVYTLGLGLDRKDFQSCIENDNATYTSISPEVLQVQRENVTADTPDIIDNNGDTAVFDINDFKENS